MKNTWTSILVGVAIAIVIGISLPEVNAQESDETVGVTLEIPDGAEAGEGFDVGKATDAYISLLSEEDRARSGAYMEGGYWLQLWGFLYGLGVAWLLLGTRLSARMRDLSERFGRWRWLHTFIYGMQYVVIGTILSFPLTVYQGFVREHSYNLATQSFGSWMGDQLTGLVVGVLLGSIALTLIYAVIRKAPNTWWVWGTGVSVVFLMFVNFIAPVYIAPLFNDYKTLEEGPLRDSIMSMARANGIPGDDVYWFDASRQTTRISANVSGFFGTTRISLNDNLLNRTSTEEVEAVMAHEMGHYVLNHGMKLTINFGLLLAVGFAFVAWGFNRALSRWGTNWGVRDVGDTAGLPLFAALLSIFFFVATPVSNGIIRVHETEADNYGINVSRQPDGFARVAMRLSEYRKISPGSVERLIFYHHPSGYDRVHMSMLWKSQHQESKPVGHELRVAGDRLFVKVEINGHKTEALLDSGAEMSLIDAAFARELSLVAVGTETARGTGGTQEVSFVENVDIVAAGVNLNDRTVVVLDLSGISERLVGEQVNAIVGRDLFDSGRFFLDIEGRKFSRVENGDEPQGIRLPLTENMGIMQIPITVEGLEEVQADFDLGNGSELLVGHSYAMNNGLLAAGRVVGTKEGGGIGGSVTRDLIELETVTVAGVTIESVGAAIDSTEDATAANVGVSVLRNFVMTIDFAEKAVWLARREP